MSLVFPYPQEVIADMYVSRVGGFSGELEKKEIGINALALSTNTSIIANETEARLKFFNEKTIPYFLKRKYKIIGLEEHMDGYNASLNGEVVFSAHLEDERVKLVEGKAVIINTVESFRIDDDYSAVVKALRKKIWI